MRPATAAFEEIPKLKIEKEMVDLAKYILPTKVGELDPAKLLTIDMRPQLPSS